MDTKLQIWWIEKRGAYETLHALRNDLDVSKRGRVVLENLKNSAPFYGRLYRGAMYEHQFTTPLCTSVDDTETRDYGPVQYIIDVAGVRAIEFTASNEGEVLLDACRITETMRANGKNGVTYIWVTAVPR